MKVAGWLRRHVANGDPAVAASNMVALVVAGNGPFYPLYAQALIGWDSTGAWLTMAASPLFALVPALSRRYPVAGLSCPRFPWTRHCREERRRENVAYRGLEGGFVG